MKKSLREKRVWILIGIVGVVALGAISWYGYSIYRNMTQSKKDSPAVSANKNAQSIYQEFNGDVADKKSFDGADNKLLLQYKTAKSVDEKGVYGAARVKLYTGSARFADALKIATEMDNELKTHFTSAVVAGVYRQMKDYSNAAKYFKIAAERDPKANSPKERTVYNDYMLMKQRMERGDRD